MKICFLASADSIHSYRWVKFFADKGHEVHWISFIKSIFKPIEGVHYYEFLLSPGRIVRMFPVFVRVRRLVGKIMPDILHAHYVGTYGLGGALTGFQPFITSAWGSDILFAGRAWHKRPFVKYALGKSRLITTDAHHMIDAMKAMGVEESKMKLICFGIDTQQFRRSEEDRRATRESLNLGESPTVISLRTLDPLYDVGTLIRAAPRILKQVPQAVFLIVGDGSQKQELYKLAKDLGIAESMRFLGRIPNHQLPRYLSATDLYVSTSLSDAGIAASTAEAMACQTPVVVTNSGENSLWVQDGKSGFVVPLQDPDKLADRLIVLLKDKEMRVRFGALGRETIKEKNDYHNEMSKMETIYQDICLKGRPACAS